tara:strand:- start:92 stop:592 length:501 start_codon:yes stop_codon:yes gene_type:complete
MSTETKTHKTICGYKINLSTNNVELTRNQMTAFITNLDVIKSAGLDIDFDTFVKQNLSKMLGANFSGKFTISEGKGVSANTPVMDRINAKIEELKKEARDSGEAYYVNGKTIFLDANGKPKELSTTFCKRTPKGQDPLEYEKELLRALSDTMKIVNESETNNPLDQ